MADSLEMALLAILAPAVRCEWNLSHWHEAFLTTVRSSSTAMILKIIWFILFPNPLEFSIKLGNAEKSMFFFKRYF